VTDGLGHMLPALAWLSPLEKGAWEAAGWRTASPTQAWERPGWPRAQRRLVKGPLTMTDGSPSQASPIMQDGVPGPGYKYLSRPPAQECKWWH
jgi:hypothetical protein